MKIDKVTTVTVMAISARHTSGSSRTCLALALMVITMFTMIVTDLIGRPLEANLGNTWGDVLVRRYPYDSLHRGHHLHWSVCLPYFLGVHGQPLRFHLPSAAFLVLWVP